MSKEIKNKTLRRSIPSKQSLGILKEKLKLEHDLYHFIKQRFNEQLQLIKYDAKL